MMEGALWRDPERVDDWIGELSKSEPVVTFCVYGFHIGCETAVHAAKSGIRREIHGRRTLRVEGDQGARQAIELGGEKASQ